MSTTTTQLQLFNVLDASGEIVYQGTISGCSHWVDRNPQPRVCVQRVNKKKHRGTKDEK